ncbi:AI-2E family transporter [Actinoplanes teichomyceticus]|uniref:Putative PurR-regulated permease PerM n=1 Tax=Actinoplanes teichomyceticus TaxID=1867 RepID=A0A561WNV2_ACTTI|nr:AI-2E family transporter [Actinoplanes teichomyceticus]TWG25525.1 putative PurR-regulated permease PerM [Actinoplanes teichomyceticus]GIF10596.1 AI-2E family transporter [Actinoplanes teichomyceticus]
MSTEPPASPHAEPAVPGQRVEPADASGPDDGPEAGKGRFGAPGRPLNRRSPFLFGFLSGLGVIAAYALFLGVRNAASILVLISIALFLAIGLNPAVVRLRRWGLPRGPAVAIVSLTVVALLAGGIVALIPPLVTQTTELINNAPGTIENLRRSETVNELVQRYDIVNKVQSAVNAGTIGNALGGVVGGAKLIFGTIFNVLTVLVLTIYFMASFDRIKEAGYSLVPASRRDRVRLLADEILTKVGAYMVGALAIAILAGLSTFVLALLLDLPYPFALAVVVAVCDLIPQIGATIGAVIVSLVGLASSVTDGVVCIVFFIVYQQVENYLIYPNVMRRSVKVSDVAAVVAALLGVALFGVVGALVAIPMVAAVQLITREVLVPSMDQR